MYNYRRSLFKNRLVLGLLLLACVVFLTVHYKETSSGALHRLQRDSLSIAAPLQVGLTKITSPFKHSWNWTRDIVDSGEQYRRVREQNTLLQKETVDYREMKAENQRLKRLLELKDSLGQNTCSANVISQSSDNYQSTIEIDKGTNDGLHEDMPVVCPEGVVGTVIASGPKASKVKLITDTKSGIAAMIQESRACGIASGNGSDELDLEYIKQNSKAKKGDLVITSGLGGIFPKGLLIGVISFAPKGIGADLYREIRVSPSVVLGSLEAVVVIKDYPKKNYIPL